MKTVFLEDKGQDLLRLKVDQDHKIFAVEPTTTNIFVGYAFPPEQNKIGEPAILTAGEETITLRYKVMDIK